jgi:hypothetical protein
MIKLKCINIILIEGVFYYFNIYFYYVSGGGGVVAS